MTAKSAEMVACSVAAEIVRCECGAHMQWTTESLNAGLGWRHKHRCLRPGCGSEEWLDKKFPRLVVSLVDGWNNDPLFIVDPSRVGYE